MRLRLLRQFDDETAAFVIAGVENQVTMQMGDMALGQWQAKP